jgi:L-cysteine:1D-myo-inositol 2-amino-2-deoxy-alpha-D-glucopyranoside ligase
MLAWPDIYRPSLPTTIIRPDLRLRHSYSGEMVTISCSKTFTMYVCGITPYDATHIGHAATYLTFDLVHRYLKAIGVDVRFLENVTDIDDPLFERAARDGIDWKTLGDDQLRLFISDMTNLRVLPPMELSTVTEAMPRILAFITDLQEHGLTYQIDSDTYLDAAKVSDFSDLPMQMDQALKIFSERGGDPGRAGKRHPLDPLLWRSSADGEPEWVSPFGAGRPGWHVECNAISSALLNGDGNSPLSLQGGGADLRFPHHYMTSLQGKARSGHDFASLYVHAGMIRYRGEKMSKSLGNLVFVSQLVDSGVHPMAIRLALISGHYRDERDWSDALLREGERLIDGLLRTLAKERILPYDKLMDSIMDALADDLDTPRVCSLLDEAIRINDSNPESSRSDLMKPGTLARFLDTVLGIAL